ncbi:3-deoxy-7-phosphoheptulonate synthase [Candidatus Marinamargulisbacteria bacterium SCGC AG-343-D04]|nr:3-deoxy-7-phosphoheptulonate synthase [Candidatus Marinamargulisbacteria bacterium SCGC AG-343-D04]
MTKKVTNLNVDSISDLSTPLELREAIPVSSELSEFITDSRKVIQDIIAGRDKRLLVVVGPCSIHDPKAAYEYAEKLVALNEKVGDQMFIVMRVYFEKPRTTMGWKGLINDPDMNQSFDIDKGLRMGREVLSKILSMGLPTASEMLDTIVPQYISDLVCWASLGARTTESQPHREMASGLSMPVGFKNATNGDASVAINAMKVAQHSHCFVGTSKFGKISLVTTKGNEHGHLILRGGSTGPNFDPITLNDSSKRCSDQGLSPRIMIDCSHGNSKKKQENQSIVFTNIISQIKRGSTSILGVMLESNLEAGNQSIPDDLSKLEYGVSVTDECMDWKTTETILLEAAKQLST